ncbi:hypothetical protein CEW83_20075 [Parazoarcus communis]|uniref:RidA/YER057c/UK114 family protein n=1 Tax=Parazoarcus communis TaxID=41977 RepID=A0A2U8GXS1_9RHOO|nr:RidA family protein [Parazoarcus communis]AWI77245.1 hypothetical protein CEW83_20075 [Parazoarcus communis]
MQSIQRKGTTARYSDSVVHNGVAYIVEVPTSTDGDIGSQTQEILDSLARQLEDIGSSTSRILSASIYLTDMADYAGMNAAWDAWVPAGTAPSRACLQVVALAQPGWRVEIAITAAVA